MNPINPPAIVSVETEREELVGIANMANDEWSKDTRAALLHAKKAGEALIKAKDLCKHGEWLPLLRKRFRASLSTAASFMRIARGWSNLQSVANLKEAIKILADVQDEQEKLQPGEYQQQTAIFTTGKLCSRCRKQGIVQGCKDCAAMNKPPDPEPAKVTVPDDAGDSWSGPEDDAGREPSEPPVETRPVPTTQPRTPRGESQASVNGHEHFRLAEFTEHLGKATAVLDRLPRQYGLVKAARKGFMPGIVETDEYKAIRKKLTEAREDAKTWEADLKSKKD